MFAGLICWLAVNGNTPLNLDVVLAKEEIVDTKKGKIIRFRLSNNSKEVIKVSAYGPNWVRLVEQQKFAGKWETKRWDWCGTGVVDLSIEPGKSLVINYPFPPPGKTVRIGVIRERMPANKDGTIWSEPVSNEVKAK